MEVLNDINCIWRNPMRNPAYGSTIKKIGWRAWLLFVMTLLVTLIITAPAALLAKVVEHAGNGQFVLANTAGTVWKGSATPAIRQRAGTLLVMEKLHWDISLLPLFTGKMVVEFRWDNVEQAQAMTMSATFGQIEIRNAIIPIQAVIIGELMPMLQPAQLSGQLQIRSDQFTFTKTGANGNAVAEWLNAGSVLSMVNPLGSYRINLAGTGERLDIMLGTISGVLVLEGSGSFSGAQGLRFQATAHAAADSKGSIDELLNNLGPETAPGVHTLNLMR